MMLPLVVLACCVPVVLAPALAGRPRHAHWVLALFPAAVFVSFLAAAPEVTGGKTIAFHRPWVEGLGVDVAFRLDGLALMFGLLISGIGTLVVIYAGAYLGQKPYAGRFFAILFAFMASMLGLVLADNLVLLFVFWELTSITSYGLISLESEKEAARKAALQALLVTAGGGLALLGGFVLLAVATGTQDITALTSGSLQGVRHYDAIVLLLFAGAFTKSAQFPFHFWLPNAMAAPTPVSAYLHSATMVKAGVYLLLRLNPSLGGTDLWIVGLSVTGAATMVTGAVLAMREDDLKRILAYVTVAILGALVMLVGVGESYAITAAIVLLLAHALYKACLFLVAGIVDHETGTRSVSQIGGLARSMPLTATAAMLAAVSMAGIPLTLGFVAKELTYEGLLHASRLEVLLLVLAVAANALMIATAFRSAVRPFIGSPGGQSHAGASRTAYDPGPGMLAGPIVLGVAGLVFGLFPATLDPLVDTAATAALGSPASVHLAAWHGVNTALLLSLLTFAAGAGAIAAGPVIAQLVKNTARTTAPVSPERIYERLIEGLNRLASAQTAFLQSGYLRRYVATTFLVVAALPIATLLILGGRGIPGDSTRLVPFEVVVLGVIVLGALFAVVSNSRITAVMALGMTGYGIALVYLFFGAPDLAMTQVLVETLAVLVFVFAFRQLPQFRDLSSRATKARDAAIAVSAGAMVTVMLLAVLSTPGNTDVSRAIADASKPLGHGSNIVNVILVDFRALDTLGEIVVLGIAAAGVLALFRMRALRTKGVRG